MPGAGWETGRGYQAALGPGLNVDKTEKEQLVCYFRLLSGSDGNHCSLKLCTGGTPFLMPDLLLGQQKEAVDLSRHSCGKQAVRPWGKDTGVRA